MGTVPAMERSDRGKFVASDLFTTDGDDAVVVSIHAQPGAGRTEVVGRHGSALKVRVAAPPEQGRANDAVVALLAEKLGVPAASISLTVGATSRTKAFRIAGVEPATFGDKLELLLGAERPGGRARR